MNGVEVRVRGRGLFNLSEPVRESDALEYFAAQRISSKEAALRNAKLRRLVAWLGSPDL